MIKYYVNTLTLSHNGLNTQLVFLQMKIRLLDLIHGAGASGLLTTMVVWLCLFSNFQKYVQFNEAQFSYFNHISQEWCIVWRSQVKCDELCLRARLGFELPHLPAVALLANLFHKYQPLSQGAASVTGTNTLELYTVLYRCCLTQVVIVLLIPLMSFS